MVSRSPSPPRQPNPDTTQLPESAEPGLLLRRLQCGAVGFFGEARAIQDDDVTPTAKRSRGGAQHPLTSCLWREDGRATNRFSVSKGFPLGNCRQRVANAPRPLAKSKWLATFFEALQHPDPTLVLLPRLSPTRARVTLFPWPSP